MSFYILEQGVQSCSISMSFYIQRNIASKYKGAEENLVSLTYMELTETKERGIDIYLLTEHWRII
jgi:hypothetical protein